MKRIIVACGTGMATSSMIAAKVKVILDANNIDYTLTQCQLNELATYKNADLFITSMKVNDDYGIPIVIGTPFLIGIGEEAAKERILSILK